MTEEYLQEARAILGRATEVRIDDALIADVGADSLEVLELVLAAEDLFHVVFPEEYFDELRTLRDIVDWAVAASDREAG